MIIRLRATYLDDDDLLMLLLVFVVLDIAHLLGLDEGAYGDAVGGKRSEGK